MKGDFLTARWNNILSIGLGVIAAIYVIVVLTSTAIGDAASFIGLVVIGGVGCLMSETHSAVRFMRTRWRIKRHTHPTTVIGWILGGGALAIILLTFYGKMEYTTGFIVLAAIIFLLVGFNILRNAVLK